ncbi:MAG TPA: hypothetical protein VK820_06835 [Steroidobacteraceae bacterium]|jgi:hypothetical protein|nr:hypothetical protein [Steroidobacteraceae bacterium]
MSAPRELVFFCDRDLGRQFPQLLREAGLKIRQHDDHFGPNTPDEEWIGDVGRRQWIAITRDTRIRYSPLALSVLMQSGAQLFVLVGKLTTTEAAATFLRWREKISSTVFEERGGFIAKVRRDGVYMWLREQEWRERRR